MKKKKNISKADFLNYLNADKGINRHVVEREALSNPFMEEAMEGYADWNREESLRSIEALDQRIKPAENSWRIAGMAASVLLLITLTAVWIFNLSDRSSELAVKSEDTAKDSPAKNKTKDEKLSITNLEQQQGVNNPITPSDGFVPAQRNQGPVSIQSIESGSKVAEESDLAKGELDAKAEEEVILPPASLLDSMRVIKPTIERPISPVTQIKDADDMTMDEVSRQAESKKEKRKESSAPKETSNKKSKSRSASTEDLEAPSNTNISKADGITSGGSIPSGYATTQKLNKIKDFYAQKEYKKSLAICSEVLVSEPLQQDALYYSGLNERALNHPEAAVRHLEKVTKSSIFYYNSKWNLYELSTTDPAKAKAILTELASEPNDFQEKAKQLLGF